MNEEIYKALEELAEELNAQSEDANEQMAAAVSSVTEHYYMGVDGVATMASSKIRAIMFKMLSQKSGDEL